MRERLGEVAELPPRRRVVLLGEQAYIVGDSGDAFEHAVRVGVASQSTSASVSQKLQATNAPYASAFGVSSERTHSSRRWP